MNSGSDRSDHESETIILKQKPLDRARSRAVGGLMGITLAIATLSSMPGPTNRALEPLRTWGEVATDASQWGRVVTLIEVPFKVDPSISSDFIYAILPKDQFEKKAFKKGSRFHLELDVGSRIITVLAIYAESGAVVVDHEQSQVWRTMRRSTLTVTGVAVGFVSLLLLVLSAKEYLAARRPKR